MRTSHLAQEPVFPPGATPSSELSVAQRPLREALEEHARLSASLEHTYDEGGLERLTVLVEQIEHLGGWDTAFESRKLLDRLGVDPTTWDQPIELLSGGQKRRVAIARALLTRADLLMFDEPTNHLDAETVEWLQDELDSRDSALLLVTHDRSFLDKVATALLVFEGEGKIVRHEGNYDLYRRLQAQQKKAPLPPPPSKAERKQR